MARKQGSNISVFVIQRSFVFCIQLLHLGLWAHCSGIDSDTIRCVIPAVITRDQGNILLQFAQKGRRNGSVMSSTVKYICPKSGRLHPDVVRNTGSSSVYRSGRVRCYARPYTWNHRY